MGKFNQYKIDLISLPNETTIYSYVLDQEFFDAINHEEVKKGSIKAELAVRKTIDAYEFDFHLVGTIQIPCDRCLDEMNQEIDTKNRLVVRLGLEYSEDSDELVTVPQDNGHINIAWYMYEFIVLDIPIKHVHDIEDCNKAMLSKYRQHQAVDMLNDNISSESSEDDIDPRWDELRKLKK